MENFEVVNTPLGSTIKSTKFQVGQFVKSTNLKDVWVVLSILENDKYTIGRNGELKEVNGRDLTLTNEEV